MLEQNYILYFDSKSLPPAGNLLPVQLRELADSSDSSFSTWGVYSLF